VQLLRTRSGRSAHGPAILACAVLPNKVADAAIRVFAASQPNQVRVVNLDGVGSLEIREHRLGTKERDRVRLADRRRHARTNKHSQPPEHHLTASIPPHFVPTRCGDVTSVSLQSIWQPRSNRRSRTRDPLIPDIGTAPTHRRLCRYRQREESSRQSSQAITPVRERGTGSREPRDRRREFDAQGVDGKNLRAHDWANKPTATRFRDFNLFDLVEQANGTQLARCSNRSRR